MSDNHSWFENVVLIATPMKTGGTLFNNLLDGNEEMFVFPDLPYFRLLTQRQCISDKHLVMDWILGSKFIGQYPEKELSNFDREDEYTPIPQEYIDLAFSKNLGVPLARRCPFCRIKEKFEDWLKQMKLTDRQCSECSTRFRTPYAQEEYPTVWCLDCYKQKVLA